MIKLGRATEVTRAALTGKFVEIENESKRYS